MKYVLSFILSALVLSISYWGDISIKTRTPSSVNNQVPAITDVETYDPLVMKIIKAN